MADRRRTYAPVLGTGVLAAVVTATMGARELADVDAGASGAVAPLGLEDRASLPLATTLALVVLACWGVVLVTRGRVRRAVAVLGAVAALGVLATVVAGWWLLPAALRDGVGALGTDVGAHLTASYWLALLAALVSSAASVAAVVLVGSWPEMGTRYDTPGGGGALGGSRVRGEADDDLALWKAMDEGRDPTA